MKLKIFQVFYQVEDRANILWAQGGVFKFWKKEVSLRVHLALSLVPTLLQNLRI